MEFLLKEVSSDIEKPTERPLVSFWSATRAFPVGNITHWTCIMYKNK